MLHNSDPRKKKCLTLTTAIELMRLGCDRDCDFCPIIRECEKYFKVEPREWKYENRNT